MTTDGEVDARWDGLPVGARAALEEQWAGLAAGGLPCGCAIVDATGDVVARGRNRAYDAAGDLDSRLTSPLQHNRLAHAELNALATLPTEADLAPLTLWTTQHPCAMCAAAIAFVGVGHVRYIADDPSDDSPEAGTAATRKGVDYRALADPFWWTVANVLFLYISAVRDGADAGNMKLNRERYPALVELTLDLARRDVLGERARSGASLPATLTHHAGALLRVAGQLR